MAAVFRVLLLCILLSALVLANHNQPACIRGAYRSYEGDCNNNRNPTWGQAGFPFVHLEGTSPIFSNLPNERIVSNRVFAYPYFKLEKDYTPAERRTGLKPDCYGRNHLFVAFSQMISHDMGQNPLLFDRTNIFNNYAVQIIEPNDPLYEPQLNNKTGLFTIKSQGVVQNGVFKSFNNASSYLDAAPIYGHRIDTVNRLRLFSGGKLKTHQNAGLFLVKQDGVDNGVPNECGSFGHDNNAAGDLRVDENIVLTALHTIWMREHNYWADQYAASHPTANDEKIFQEARKKVIAIWQHIIIDELMPTLIGPAWNRRLGDYDGYDDDIDASTAASFSTAAFRVVHDLVPLPVLVLHENCSASIPPVTIDRPTQERGNCIPAFFQEVGLEAVVRGAVNQFAQAQDNLIVDGIRNVLLQASTRGGNLDVEVANIFRGREHRVPSFNVLRKHYTGKSLYQERGCNEGTTIDPIRCFNLLTNNRTLAGILQDLYKKVAYVDAYVGLILEAPRHPFLYPRLATKILLTQFEKTRAGDWWWYENRDNGMFTKSEINAIKDITFAEVVKRHVNVEIDDDAFETRNDCPLL